MDISWVLHELYKAIGHPCNQEHNVLEAPVECLGVATILVASANVLHSQKT